VFVLLEKGFDLDLLTTAKRQGLSDEFQASRWYDFPIKYRVRSTVKHSQPPFAAVTGQTSEHQSRETCSQ